jgi:hypothetical protein
VGKNSVLFAHVPEPDLQGYGGVEKNNSVFFSHTYQILVEQQWSDKAVKRALLYTVVPSNKRFLKLWFLFCLVLSSYDSCVFCFLLLMFQALDLE